MFNKLQYISQGTTKEEQLKNIELALEAGCKWIQLRFKNSSDEELIALGKKVRVLCTDHNALFILNDHPHIAHTIHADGVHVGLTDMKVAEARRILGHNKIIGGTANTLQHILQRVEEGCNYVGLGPFRFTATKEKLSPILGLQAYERIVRELGQRNISIPIYAIGGILLHDTTTIMQAGIYGVAVSGLITHHPEKKILIEQFNTLLYETINDSQ